MPQVAKTKPFEAGDVYIREDLSREYDSESMSVANAGTTHIFYPPGTPFTSSSATVAAQTATDAATTGTDLLVLEGIWVPPGGCKVAMLKRPVGVVVNANALPNLANAPAGVNGITYTHASLTAMLTRLQFVWRLEPLRWDLQTR